jgi:transcriptional regulator with XRE-family HTH domain
MNLTFAMIDDRREPGIQDVLAANLRRLRIARHLSLSELARATATSKATLSGIENGRSNPTVETLAALAGALRVPVGELLDEPPAGAVRVVRAAASRFGRRDGLAQRPLEAAGPVELAEIALEPRQRQEAAPRAAGTRAGVFVLEGLLIAGPVERGSELGRGDYMAFPADVPHAYESGPRAARALLLTHAGG